MMNERIEELMFEAGRYADKKIGSSVRSGMWMYQYSEKFAELIVKECIQAVSDDGIKSDWYQHLIKQHFGVEE